MSKNIIGFVMKGEEVVKTIYPANAEDVKVEGGALRATDYDGEVHIFAAGEWTGAQLRAPEEDE